MLKPGSIIYSINECQLSTSKSWFECLRQLEESPNGFCMSNTEINQKSSKLGIHF